MVTKVECTQKKTPQGTFRVLAHNIYPQTTLTRCRCGSPTVSRLKLATECLNLLLALWGSKKNLDDITLKLSCLITIYSWACTKKPVYKFPCVMYVCMYKIVSCPYTNQFFHFILSFIFSFSVLIFVFLYFVLLLNVKCQQNYTSYSPLGCYYITLHTLPLCAGQFYTEVVALLLSPVTFLFYM